MEGTTMQQRARRGPPPERDRQAMRDGHARAAEADEPRRTALMPGTCAQCGMTVWLQVWPQVYWGDEYGRRHQCRYTVSGEARLNRIAAERAANIAAAANRRAQAMR